jgi:hypothetical protein
MPMAGDPYSGKLIPVQPGELAGQREGRARGDILRDLGWPIPKTALTASIIALCGTEAEGYDGLFSRTQCDCTPNLLATTITVLTLIVTLYAAFHLGRRSATGTTTPAHQAARQEDQEDIEDDLVDDAASVAWSLIPEAPARPALNADGEVGHVKDVLMQGPVRYKRKNQHPRYAPLPDGLWGALVTAER